MVADGSGSVWIRGRWNLTRLDPNSGTATTWDASDFTELAASDLALASSERPGVWLLLGAHARLFDGQAMVSDLEVPEQLLSAGRARGVTTSVLDVAEVGAAVWVSLSDEPDPASGAEEGLSSRVVRWSNGAWTAMSDRGDGISGLLATDSDGGVWASGAVGVDDESGVGPAVHRWDGSTWVRTSPNLTNDDLMLPVEVVADPTRGVWLLCSQCARDVDGSETGLLRFDDQTWHAVGADEVAALVRETGYGNLGGDEQERAAWLSVSPDGTAWLAGEYGVLRFSADGAVQLFGTEQGLEYHPEENSNPIQGIAATAGGVLVLDSIGVLRLDGDRFTRLWLDPLAVPASSDSYGLLAVSAHEAWLVHTGWTGEAAWQRLMRYRDGEWSQVGPDADTELLCVPVLASDGAVWTARRDGLVRATGDAFTVVAKDLTACPELAGPNGSVWLVDGFPPLSSEEPTGGTERVVQVQIDGTRAVAGRPKGFDTVCLLAAGPDGSAWVSGGHLDIDDDAQRCPGEGEDMAPGHGDVLARWNGRRWLRVSAPAGLEGMTVSGGNTWAAASAGEADGRLDWYTFVKGAWQKVARDTKSPSVEGVSVAEDGSRPVLPAPGGGACVQAGEVLACVQPGGAVSHVGAPERGTPSGVREFSLGPDGSVWVLGPQLARLAQVVPTGG